MTRPSLASLLAHASAAHGARPARMFQAGVVGALGLIGLGACADKEFTPPHGMRSPMISLQLTIAPPARQATPTPRFLLVAALYERETSGTGQGDDDIELLAGLNVVAASGTQTVNLPVDLTRCLADNSRRGSKGACSIFVVAALTYKEYDFNADSGGDPLGESFDYRFIGPFDAAPGRAPSVPPIDLSASRFGVIGLQADDALRLGGHNTPAGFSGALTGVPGAGSAPPVLFATTQGLVFPTDPQQNSQPQGPYPQLAIHENGGWRRVTATALLSAGTFTDVAALAANDVYLAHRSGLFKYDGTTISKVTQIGDSLFSVATGGGAVIAGGWSGVVWIGSGQSWQRYVLPTAPFLNGGVCITGPNEAFAASGAGGLFRFDGNTWTSAPAATTSGKVNLECPAPGQAFVLAQNNQQLRWNGSSWVALAALSPQTGRSFNWAVSSASEIYAVSDSANIDRAFYRYDGSVWKQIGRLRFTQPYVLPWADPRGGAYVGSQFGRVERVTSSAVSVVSYQPSFRDVIMTSVSSAFVVGQNAFLGRWDGAKWNVDAPPALTPTNRDLRSVWSNGPNNAWAVGGSSTIYRYDGSAWSAVSDSPKPVAAADTYNGVWGAGADVWAVGNSTIVHCRSATNCVNESSGGSGALNSVWGTSASNVLAVGAAGRIIRFDGTSWTSMASPTTRALYRVAGSGPNDVWAVGDSVALHFDGSTWASAPLDGDLSSLLQRFSQPSGNSTPSIGLWARNANEVYMTTVYGAIGRYDGERWYEPYSVFYGHQFVGISGAAGGCALAVTEAQNDNRASTLWRGIGPSGCFSSPMTAPSSWP